MMGALARHGHRLGPGRRSPLPRRRQAEGRLSAQAEVGGGWRRK
jgi:hypothetical protein